MSIAHRNAKPVTYQGVEYPSLSALGRKFGVNPQTLAWRYYKRGIRDERLVSRRYQRTI